MANISWREYRAAVGLELKARSNRFGANEFYSLLLAAMRTADSSNIAALKQVFPQVFEQLGKRYNAPAGCLTDQELEAYEAWLRGEAK